MYKSSFLSHIARAGKGQAFFTQNVTGANTTALSLVKPKLGIVTERAYFSSWGSNTQHASNTSGSSTSQTVLMAISSDDSQSWERDLSLHRKKFRSIAGIRRYSTGTQTSMEQSSQNNMISLIAEHDTETVDDEANSAVQDISGPSDSVESLLGEVTQERLLPLDAELGHLFQGQSYLPVLQRLSQAIAAHEELSVTSFNTTFRALLILQKQAMHDHAWRRKISSFLNADRVLGYYTVMLENDILPEQSTYTYVLQLLTRFAKGLPAKEKLLDLSGFVRGTAQEKFLDIYTSNINSGMIENVIASALEIFQASNSVRPVVYPALLLEDLLWICSIRGTVEQAINIFDHYDRINLIRSGQTYRLLLAVFAKSGDMVGAVECFNLWKKECANMLDHDYLPVYDMMIRCYFASGDIEGGERFFNLVRKTSTTTSLPQYKRMLICYADAGQFETALNFARLHLNRNELIYSEALGIIIPRACTQNQVNIAREYFKQVTSIFAFAQVPGAVWKYLGTLTTNGHLDEALDLVANCLRQDIELRLLLLSSLSTKLLDAGRVDDALEIANNVARRRAISNTRELGNKNVALYVQILLTDMKRLNLIDSKTIPKLAEIQYLAGRHQLLFSEAKDFLFNIKNQMALDDWLDHPALVNQICVMSFNYLGSRSHGREDSQDMLFSPTAAQSHVSWLAEVVTHIHSKGFDSAIPPATIHTLNTILSENGMRNIVQSTGQITNSLPGSSAAQPDFAQLPTQQAVFIPFHDARIDNHLSREINFTISIESKEGAQMQSRADAIQEKVISCFQRMAEQGPVLSGDILIKAILYFGRVRNPDILRSLLELSPTLLPSIILSPELFTHAQAIVANGAIMAYNDLGDSQMAQKYYEELRSFGFVPSADAYASFIARMDEDQYRDCAARAMSLFSEARNFGVPPTGYLYNTVIARLAKARRNDEALTLFEEMKSSGLTPTGVTYGTVINSCCRVGQTARAEELLIEMESLPSQQARIAPYNTLIQHFVQTKKDRAKAFYYWDKLQARAIRPTFHSYRLLIEAHGHLQPVNTSAAESVLALMHQSGTRPSSMHHAALIHMYGVVLKDLDAAKKHFKYFTAGHSPRVIADDVLYQSIIEACVVGGDFEGMHALLEQMKQKKVPLNAYIVNIAIDGFARNDRLSKARALFDQLPTAGAGHRGKEPSTYEAMIRAYAAADQREAASEILELLKAQDFPEAVVHHAQTLIEHPKDQSMETNSQVQE